MMIEGATSYQSWAYYLTRMIGTSVTKQAIFKRMDNAWVETLKSLVGIVMKQQWDLRFPTQLFSSFVNVWIQDSTSVKLPEVLFDKYKGSSSKGGKYSVAKLNVVINLVSGLCKTMEWNSYNVTEQFLSTAILGIASKGDLVIRDLGYFVLNVFREMDEAGIYFLTRWRYGVNLYEVRNGNQIYLEKLLKGKLYLDINILCGKEGIPMRLVAIKISDDQAAVRKRKAKKDTHRNVNHDKTYYYLLGYVIFLTNVKKSIWSYLQVAEAYRTRWNIEILFKSWKSKLHLEKMIPEAHRHTPRIEGWLYLLLLYICWFQQIVYLPLKRLLKDNNLSILRITQWAIINTSEWLFQGLTLQMRKELLLFCSYEKRRRINASNRLHRFLTPLG